MVIANNIIRNLLNSTIKPESVNQGNISTAFTNLNKI